MHPRKRKSDISGNIRVGSLKPYVRESRYSRAILVLFHNLFFPCVSTGLGHLNTTTKEIRIWATEHSKCLMPRVLNWRGVGDFERVSYEIKMAWKLYIFSQFPSLLHKWREGHLICLEFKIHIFPPLAYIASCRISIQMNGAFVAWPNLFCHLKIMVELWLSYF